MAKHDYFNPEFQSWVSQQPISVQQQMYVDYQSDLASGSISADGSAVPQSGGTGAQLGGAVGQLGGTAASGYIGNAMFGGGSAAAGAAGASGASAGLGAAAGASGAAGLGAGAGAAGAGLGTAGAGGAFAGATATGTATGAGTLAGTSGSIGAAGGSSVAGTAAAAAPYLAALVTAYQSFENYKNAKKSAGDGAMTDKEVSTIYSPWRSMLGKGAGKFGEFMDQFSPGAHIMKGILGSSKDEDQIYRDRLRSQMKKNNFIGEDYKYNLADGSQFDMGVDGSHMLQNMGTNIDGNTQRHTYDVDFSNPNAGGFVAAAQGLGAIMSGQDGKQQRDMTGMLVNAAMSSGDPMQNIMKMYQDAGLDHDSAYGLIHEMAQNKKLDPAFADAVKNALDQSYGVGAYKGQGSQFGAPPSPAMTSGPAIKAPSGMSAAVIPVRDPGMGTGQKPMTQPARVPQVSPVRGSSQPQVVQAPNSPRGILSIAPKAPTIKPASPSRPMTPTSSAAVPTPKSTPSAVIKPVNKPMAGTKELVIPPGMTYEQYMQFMNAQQAPMPTKAAPKGRALGNFGRGGN